MFTSFVSLSNVTKNSSTLDEWHTRKDFFLFRKTAFYAVLKFSTELLITIILSWSWGHALAHKNRLTYKHSKYWCYPVYKSYLTHAHRIILLSGCQLLFYFNVLSYTTLSIAIHPRFQYINVFRDRMPKVSKRIVIAAVVATKADHECSSFLNDKRNKKDEMVTRES